MGDQLVNTVCCSFQSKSAFPCTNDTMIVIPEVVRRQRQKCFIFPKSWRLRWNGKGDLVQTARVKCRALLLNNLLFSAWGGRWECRFKTVKYRYLCKLEQQKHFPTSADDLCCQSLYVHEIHCATLSWVVFSWLGRLSDLALCFSGKWPVICCK